MIWGIVAKNMETQYWVICTLISGSVLNSSLHLIFFDFILHCYGF